MEIGIQVPPIQNTLAQAVGHPDPEVLKSINTRGHATIISMLGDENELWLGKPEVFDLLSLYQLSGQSLPPQLALISGAADLLMVQFACSFRSAPECEFVQATVKILMQGDINSRETPVTQDVFPREVDMPISYKRSISVSPELKIGCQPVPQIEASAFSYERSSEYLKYEPEITAFGVGESNPGWDFNKSRARPIRGIKDLFVLIKKPRMAPLEVQFDVSALVQTSFARIPLPFFLSGSDAPLITERYVLQ